MQASFQMPLYRNGRRRQIYQSVRFARALIGWLAVRSKAATLTRVATYFHRDLSTLSHAVSSLEERSRNSESFANILNQHRYAIYQA
jgi:chromosomal replication initiation ATPase DnaA